MKKALLFALAIMLMVACGPPLSPTDSPTGPESLNTTARSESNTGWDVAAGEPSLSGISWRRVDMEGWFSSVRVSYNMTWTNNDPSRAVYIYYSLHFKDANGFELAIADGDPVTISAASSRQVGGIKDLGGVTTVSLANQISEMEVWAGFSFN